MKVTAIIASPRKGGNSEILVNEAIRGAEENGAEVTKYYLNDLDITPCQACGYCTKLSGCKIKDDVPEILDNLLDSDALIFASPIYFWQVNAQAKTLIDRFFSIFVNPEKNFSGKALLIFTHNAPEGTFEEYVKLNERLFGVLNWDVSSLTAGGVNDIGEIKSHENKLQEAYDFGKSL